MLLNKTVHIPDLGDITADSGFHVLENTEDKRFTVGKNGVCDIVATGDQKVEFVSFGDSTLACVKSAIAYPTYYPVLPVKTEYPGKAVLMDLDGTTVRSEEFWLWIIKMSIASLMGTPKFELDESDIPFVSGHSVSEQVLVFLRDKAVKEVAAQFIVCGVIIRNSFPGNRIQQLLILHDRAVSLVAVFFSVSGNTVHSALFVLSNRFQNKGFLFLFTCRFCDEILIGFQCSTSIPKRCIV